MTRNDLVLTVVSDVEGLHALASGWDRLVLAADRPSPFLLHDWVAAWWRHFGAGATLAVVTATCDTVLVGVAPMFIRRRHGLLVCRLLGDHETALGDLLVAQSDDGSIARALLGRLSQLRFDYLDVFGSPAGGTLSRLASEGKLTALQRVEAPVLCMPDGWEAAYASRISSKGRNLHRRRLALLGKRGAISWTTARTPEEVADELGHALEIHARRWQGRPDGSTFGLAGGRVFHFEAAAALAARDAVRILTLRINGRPIAFAYWFVLGTTMYGHRLAFDPKEAQFSPGVLTMLQAIANASSEGTRRVEFLGGSEPYKVQLADRMEPLCQIVGLPSGWLARIAIRTLVFIVITRMWVKRNKLLHRAYMRGFASLRAVVSLARFRSR